MPQQMYDVNIDMTVRIKIDDKVIEAVDDEFRQSFYMLNSKKEILEHLAYNAIVNGAQLTLLDGFAHLENDMLQCKVESFEVDSIEKI